MQVRFFSLGLVVVLVPALSACGLIRRRGDANPPVPPTPPPVSVEEKTDVPQTPSKHETAHDAKAVAQAEEVAFAPVPPERALQWLKNGNVRFVKNRLRNDGQGKADVERLAAGQRPHAIVLSCSDSRVPPELVFDQKLGEIFVIRTAGEALDENVIGSIEYALVQMKPQLLIVMGHTQCGVVNAAVSTLDGGDAGSSALNHILADLRPRLKAAMASEGAVKSTPDGSVESFSVARGVAADLITRSSMIREAVNAGQLKIQAALYHVDTGSVEF